MLQYTYSQFHITYSQFQTLHKTTKTWPKDCINSKTFTKLTAMQQR